VPHIYASNQRDLFFGVGYAQAQDRLWQMEFNRRLASGTLSEIVGEAALEVDRLVRRIGFRRAAERDWQEADGDERAIVEAFVAGANAYIDQGRLPLEFSLLRRRPAPWHPVDGIALGRFISWTMAGNWDSEILRSWTIERFGPEVTADLEPGYPLDGPVIVPPGTEARGPGPDLSDDFRQAAELIGGLGSGLSNNWVVDGQKSATDKPLLANDPHLPLMMPALWWELHLDSPELKAAGVGLPGTPGVMIGHNDRIAWGVTALDRGRAGTGGDRSARPRQTGSGGGADNPSGACSEPRNQGGVPDAGPAHGGAGAVPPDARPADADEGR
jgi:penicillin amidase